MEYVLDQTVSVLMTLSDLDLADTLVVSHCYRKPFVIGHR